MYSFQSARRNLSPWQGAGNIFKGLLMREAIIE
jgi:hypothetical protein